MINTGFLPIRCKPRRDTRATGTPLSVAFVAAIFLLSPVLHLASLPLEEVTLYTSGVGEFVHRGSVNGSGTLSIMVPVGSMSDVMRSLTLIDHDGGSIEAVSFATGESPDQRLGRYTVNLTDTHRMHHVLRQLRGAAVDLTISVHHETAYGHDAHDDDARDDDSHGHDARNLDEEKRSAITGNRIKVLSGTLVGAEENTILIAREEGIREVPHWQVEHVSFSDPHAQQEFRSALEELSRTALETGTRELEIAYSGTGTRRLEVRYLQETPRWHTTYRAVITPGSDQALLQGWAHVDNTTSGDWDGVRLTLVSAQPVTYQFDLYRPQYVNRPPFRQEDALDPTAPAPVAVPRMLMESAAFDRSMAESVESRMATDELITGMTFTAPDPVSLPRGRSTMVPLVNRPLSVSMTRYYDPRRDGQQPRAAFHLTNDSVVQLPAGPLTVFERNRYVGDGAITTLLPGARTVVTYARDSDLIVTTVADTADEELVTMRISDGILVAEHRTRHTTAYRVQSGTGALPGRGSSAPLLVSHPLRSGWELVSPRNVDIQGDSAQIRVTGSGETVVEERIRSQRYTLATMEDHLLVSFSANRLIDPTVRRTLQNISTLRTTLATYQRSRRELEARRDQLFADQQRISTNMAQLDRDSTLYRRYTNDLNRQENELQRLREDLEDILRDERQAEAALREYLRTL